MNKTRWRMILNCLNEKTPVTSVDLASKLNLSSKTVRNEMKILKNVLEREGAHLISKSSIGYMLRIHDPRKYDLFLNSLQEVKSIPETPQERIQYLLEVLLANGEQFVKLEDISDQIFISKPSLAADLKEVKRILKEYNLKLAVRSGYGIRVEGNEFDLRLCIAAYTIRRAEPEDYEKQSVLRKIAECIQNGIAGSELKISDVSFQNLIVHIYISLRRIAEGSYLPLSLEQFEIVVNEAEYCYAERIVALLETSFQVKVPKTEIGYIAIHLACKRIIEKPTEANLMISAEMNDIVTHMIDEIDKSYNIQFHDDLELRMVLAMHLIPFSKRMQYDIMQKNPLLKEIKSNYTLAYLIAMAACEVLRIRYQKTVQEDEVGYFALHFNLALERKRNQGPMKNILIVCSTGRGSAKLLVWKMREEFGKYLNVVETCDVLELEKYDFTNIDYVITTVPILFAVPRPILQVNLFLDDRDIKAISSFFREDSNTSLRHYFHPDLFLEQLDVNTREEVIDAMIERIKKVKKIPDCFKDAVLEREELAFTTFGNMVAIPHPNRALTEETFVCVAILKRPILWNKQKVQFVFMLSLTNSTDHDMEQFSRITSKFLFSTECIHKMIKNPRYSTLMELLGSIEKEIGE